MTTGGISLLVVVGVFMSLMVPAISMEQSTPLLEANPATVELGSKVGVKVTATARTDKDTVYLLSEIGQGGTIASSYTFNDKGEAQVKTDDGKTVTIHRVDRSKEASQQVANAEQAIKAMSPDSTTDATSAPDGNQDASQPSDIDVQTLEAERDLVDEKTDLSVQDQGETKSLYWIVVPHGTTVTFTIDHESADGSEHKLTLRGASGTTYSEAIKALQDAKTKEDTSGAKPDKEGKVLDIAWTDPATSDNASTTTETSGEASARVGADNASGDAAASSTGTTEDDATLAGLSDQTLYVMLYADESKSALSTEQGTTISIQGMLPQGATAAAYPITADIDGQTVLAAYDITVYNGDGTVFQPAEGHPVKVTISSSALQTGNEAIGVYHADSVDVDGQPQDGYEAVGTAERDDAATVSFYASHFSPYALTGPLRAPGNPGTIATEDTRSAGITLNLFDYDAYDGDYASNGNSHLSDWQYNTGINSKNGQFRDLRFYPSGISPTGWDPWTINNYTGATPTALQGVVRPTLDSNGYPHTTGFNNQNSNLSYLFDPNESANGKTTYADVNHLFTKDAAGYYRYDSGWGKRDNSGNMRNGNYAYYDTSQGGGGDFVVYDRTYTNDNTGTDASNDSIGFFPFNEYNENHKAVKLNSQYDHHLGLSMSAAFTIPEGKTVNGNDMVFNFSGDDDMWVFIDDVLVLDIGGVHQPVSGSINFTQGTSSIGQNVQSVTGQSTIGKNKSIADIFAAAGKTWDGSEYSKHTIKCFYLERGGCYSDLSLSFNLPIYNPGQIHVTKTVDGPGSANYMDTEFKFKVFIETSQNSGQYTQYTGPVTMDDGTPVGGADSDGTYALKSGQGFKISTQNDQLRYYVQEVDPGGAFSTTVNGQATGVENGVVGSPTKSIGDQPEVSYKNSVTGVTVSVQKKWYEQDGTTEQTANLPESVSLTLHRTWDTTEGGSTTPTATKHTVTFRLTSQAQPNAFVMSVDDVADGGSLTFYPYGGVKADGSGDPWSLPTVSLLSGAATLNSNGQQYITWTNVPGYKLTNITSDVTVLLTYDAWITTDHTRRDYSVPNVTEYTKAQDGGGTVTPPTPGTVTHHDEVVNDAGVQNPITVTAADGWRAEWNGLPMADAQGNPYTYYVDESTVPAGYEVVYENNGTTNGSGSHTGIPSGEITVKNKLAYTLPHTGGPGTAPLVALGTVLSGVAATLLIYRYRRAGRSEG